jgi:HEAT repeat protein
MITTMKSMIGKRRRFVWSAQVLLAGVFVGSLGFADEASDPGRVYSGRAEVYKALAPESLEDLSTPEAIKALSMPNVPPSRIWKTLEHGERVECLDCIPYVSELLYDGHPKTREIGAWWLRRRVFGVFGPGEVYSQVVQTLGDPTAPEGQRAYAADALGEFLTYAGLEPVAEAAVSDESPRVRLSAVRALGRMGHQGPHGELAIAMADESEEVRLAALEAVVRLHKFDDIDAVVACLSDDSAAVRRRAALVIAALSRGEAAEDVVSALAVLTSPDDESNAGVRQAAVSALGQLAASGAKSAVQAAEDDPDPRVRDAARIALRRL